MADIYRRRQLFGPGRRAGSRDLPEHRMVVLDYLYYLLLVAVVAIFIYYLFFFRSLVTLYLPVFLQGLLTTLVISVISMLLAIVIGFIGAMGRLSRFRPIRAIATVYVEFVRGTPMLVQLLLWFYGVSNLLASIGFDPKSLFFQIMTLFNSNSLVPDTFNSYFYGIIGLSIAYGAYLTEVFRTGIQSVDRGQGEAALSLGLTSRQIMRHIIMPQAIRITIPPLTNNFITLIQDSSLLSTLAIIELEYWTYALANPQIDANKKLFVFIFGALFYLILCYPLGRLARGLEKRLGKAY